MPKPKRTPSPQPKFGFDEGLQSIIPHFKGSNRSLHKPHSRSRASSNESTHSARARLISSEALDGSDDGSISENPYDSIPQPHLTSKDIEEIKKMAASSSHPSSECSSSTISCPDFGHYNLNPAEYVTDLQKGIAEESETSQSMDGSVDGTNARASNQPQDAESTPQNKNDGINMLIESAMKSFDSVSSIEKSQDMSDKEIYKDAEKEEKSIAGEYTYASEASNVGNMQCETTKSDSSTVHEVGNNLDNQIPTSPIKIESSQKDKKFKRRRSREWKQNLMPKLTPPSMEAVQPQPSSAAVETVATSEDSIPSPKFVLQMSVDEESEEACESEMPENAASIYDTSRRVSLGNSLTVKPGWSSAFETEAKDQIDGPAPTSQPKLLAKKSKSILVWLIRQL